MTTLRRSAPLLLLPLLAPALAALPGPTRPAAAAPAQATPGALRPVDATPPTTGEPTATPAVTSLVTGRLDVFEQSARDTLQQVVRGTDGRWTRVFDLGGPLRSAPAAASPAAREVLVVGRGAGSAVTVKAYLRGAWQPWASLGGAVDAAPAAVATSPGRVDVLVRGVNGSAYVRTWTSGRWGPWRALGGRLASAPAAATDGVGGTTLLVRGTDGALYERRYAAGAWAPRWLRVPGAPAGTVSAVGTRDGAVTAFVRDSDGTTRASARTGGAWSSWQPVPGPLASLPGAYAAPGGAVDVLARWDDGLLRRVAPTLGSAGPAWTTPEVVPVGLNRPVDRVLADGLRHRAWFDEAGPFAVQVADLRMAATPRADVALARDSLAGFEPTSSIARRHGALAAVNGDFGMGNGRPAHVYAEDGVLAQSTLETGYNLALDARQTDGRIGITGIERTFEHRRVKVRVQTTLINTYAPGPEEYAEYTGLAAGLASPPDGTCSVALRPTTAPFLRPDGRVQQEMTVEAPMSCGAQTAAPGQTLLTVPAGGAQEPFLARMRVGDEVPGTWSLAWRHVYDSIGGNPVLVQEGAVAAGNVDQRGSYFAAQPRTGVGLTADGRLLLVTVDGRQPGHSVGMTLRQFAELFVRLGATTALNLDGGGSTTMTVRGEVTNRTCCNLSTAAGEERAVSSVLMVLPGADPGEVPPGTVPTPTPTGGAATTRSSAGAWTSWPLGGSRPGPTRLSARDRDLAARVWAEVSRDPGSTGGMLAATRD